MVLAFAMLAAGLYVYATAARAPALDHESLCPIDGPSSITVALLDSTDDIPDIAKHEIRTTLLDTAETLSTYGLLDMRLLDPRVPGGRGIFSRCNPGDGSGLSEYTANPRLAKKRWLEGFRQPLEEALNGCLDDLDGFYTFLVGTADGFAVLRDPIACKPAVMAETDDWVAMASEWRAIAVLPGAPTARMWEPEPQVVYAWEKALA